MARVYKNPFLLSGKVGDQVYRVVNGKQFVAALPKKYKKSNTKASVAAREKFLFFVKLNNAIRASFVLELTWKSSPLKGRSVMQKVMKKFYNIIQDFDISNFDLCPEDPRFIPNLTGIARTGTVINASFGPLDSHQIYLPDYPQLSAHGFVYLFNPQKKRNRFEFIPLSSGDTPSSADSLPFRFTLTNAQLKKINTYPEKVFLFMLVVKDKTGKPALCSTNVSFPL